MRNQEIENESVKKWQNHYSIREAGGGDAHSLTELGRMVTRFSEPVRSREDLVIALKKGHTSQRDVEYIVPTRKLAWIENDMMS